MKPTTTNKDPLIHFPFYINQYQGLLAGYSFLEKGAFIALLCVYLSEDGQIPEESAKLFRKAGAFGEEEQLALSSVKDEVLRVGLEIIKSQKKIREKSREKASKAAKERWSKDNAPSNAPSIQQAMLEECHTETEKETETDKEIKKEKETEKKVLFESQFESFWQSYKAIHTGKGVKDQAKESFKKALKISSFEEIEQGLKNYMDDCHAKNIYTKQVSVWLNKQGWKGEYSSSQEQVQKPNQYANPSYLDYLTGGK